MKIRHKAAKILTFSVIGQIFEFYDLALIGFLSPKISHIFFPTDNKSVLIIFSLGIFCAGFIARPLGGIIFGHIGDKVGRKNSLSLSMLCMGVVTILMGCMVGYDSIGILSPIILLSLRLMQGMCIGGEYNGSAIFFIEHFKGKHIGFFSSIISAAAVVGFFTASVTVSICCQVFDNDLAWRVPFFIGGVIAIVAYLIRKSTSETPVFLQNKKERNIAKVPIVDILKFHYKEVIITVFVGWNMGSISLTIFGYLVTHLNKFIGLGFEEATRINQIAIIFYFCATLCSGYLADKFSPRNIMLVSVSTILFMSAPAYYLISLQGFYNALGGSVMLALIAGFFLGPTNLFVYGLFPSKLRYSGICFSFSTGVAVLGGIAPMVSGALVIATDSFISPALYLITSAIFGLIGVILSKSHAKQSDFLENTNI